MKHTLPTNGDGYVPSSAAILAGVASPPGLVAYSPVTGEEYTATAGDTVPPRDANGEPLILGYPPLTARLARELRGAA